MVFPSLLIRWRRYIKASSSPAWPPWFRLWMPFSWSALLWMLPVTVIYRYCWDQEGWCLQNALLHNSKQVWYSLFFFFSFRSELITPPELWALDLTWTTRPKRTRQLALSFRICPQSRSGTSWLPCLHPWLKPFMSSNPLQSSWVHWLVATQIWAISAGKNSFLYTFYPVPES